MKKVLVLGGGKVGKSVAELLLALGRGSYSSTLADREQANLEEARANIDRLKSRIPHRVELTTRVVDARDRAAVRGLLKGQDYLICANHYQSSALAGQPNNRAQMEESASLYRFHRVEELLARAGPMTLPTAAALLRDQRGLHNADIGMGNEKAVNQLIAHHSIVFQPQKLLVSVSTSPWQLGQYVTYDLRRVFALEGLQTDHEIRDSAFSIPADTFLETADYQNFVRFRQIREQLRRGTAGKLDLAAFIRLNPEYYHTYVLAGDYLFTQKKYNEALQQYQTALTKEIATLPEKHHIDRQIELCQKRLNK